MTERSGSSVPTMKDVAEKAGVSRQLVSMVLRGVDGPSERSRELILRTAESLGFQANSSARLLRQTRTNLIGVAFATRSPFESHFVECFIDHAAATGFHVVLAPQTETRTTEIVINELMGHRVEALVCFNPDPQAPALERAIQRMPVVWLGERSDDARVDVVRTDDDTGLRLAVDHLVSLGHTDIAYVGGLGGRVASDRAFTYRAAMRHAGLADHIDIIDCTFSANDAAAAAYALIRRRRLPTAIIAHSDLTAASVRAVFALEAVSVPGDVSIIGYDDSDLAGYSYNAITSVRQDIELTAAASLDAILRRLEDPSVIPRDVPTKATLTLRKSTGPARSR